MFTPIDETASSASSGASPQPDKQIGATANGANSLVYTVPAGRKFVGYCSNNSWNNGSYWAQLEVDGTVVRHHSGFSADLFSGYTGPPTPVLTLLAGTVVKVGNGGNVFVFGVESDA